MLACDKYTNHCRRWRPLTSTPTKEKGAQWIFRFITRRLVHDYDKRQRCILYILFIIIEPPISIYIAQTEPDIGYTTPVALIHLRPGRLAHPNTITSMYMYVQPWVIMRSFQVGHEIPFPRSHKYKHTHIMIWRRAVCVFVYAMGVQPMFFFKYFSFSLKSPRTTWKIPKTGACGWWWRTSWCVVFRTSDGRDAMCVSQHPDPNKYALDGRRDRLKY